MVHFKRDDESLFEEAMIDMRVVEINSVNHGSTGTIMRNIAYMAEKNGIDTTICFQSARSTKNEEFHKVIRIGSRVDRNLHLYLAYLTGKYGTYSKIETRRFVKRIDSLNPDIIHLHNLHKGYVNLEILFDFIKSKNIPVIWTLHDCWSFTGQCPYFDLVGCDKWMRGCGSCPQYKVYPSRLDKTREMFEYKKKCFLGVKNLTLVSPSKWLADLTRMSFLQEYPVRVINNGIDLDVFYPRKTDLKSDLKLIDKFIILGVASIWDARKGLEDFIHLYEMLPKDKYQIILIGLSEKQLKSIPDGILGLNRTKNPNELAEYYSIADVFFNPTKEDNFPTVNIEALACGTPVLSYGAGGSAEAFDEKSGMIVNDNNVVEVLERLYIRNYDKNDCIARGRQFEQNNRFKEYVSLYEQLMN